MKNEKTREEPEEQTSQFHNFLRNGAVIGRGGLIEDVNQFGKSFRLFPIQVELLKLETMKRIMKSMIRKNREKKKQNLKKKKNFLRKKNFKLKKFFFFLNWKKNVSEGIRESLKMKVVFECGNCKKHPEKLKGNEYWGRLTTTWSWSGRIASPNWSLFRRRRWSRALPAPAVPWLQQRRPHSWTENLEDSTVKIWAHHIGRGKKNSPEGERLDRNISPMPQSLRIPLMHVLWKK